MRYQELLETPNYLTSVQLLAIFPESKDDLKNVGEWMNSKPEELRYRLETVPFSVVETDAQSMYDNYDEYPDDNMRTMKIVKLLKAGAKALPVFIDEQHPTFVMEGRHRMVAHLILKSPMIQVVYVSK